VKAGAGAVAVAVTVAGTNLEIKVGARVGVPHEPIRLYHKT